MNKETIRGPIRENSTEYWDYSLAKISNQKILDEVIKFHQSSTYITRDNYVNYLSLDTLKWLRNTENTDVLPNMYISEHYLRDYNYLNQGSIRDFNIEDKISFESLSHILKKAFGRSEYSTSKRYPSAGGLYPVVIVICILKDFPNSELTRGAYIYDSWKHALKKIKEWDDSEMKHLYKVTKQNNKKLTSNYLIGYAIDLKRATAKYDRRGYRHALIEVGAMTQSFKESLIEEQANFGEFTSSTFDDNAITYLMGLNPRTCPISIIQWFGKKEGAL